MKEASEGIKSFFSANSTHAFYTGIGGRLYFRRAPQKVTFPYVVFFMVTGSPDYYFDGSPTLQSLSYQFSVFTKGGSAEDAETISKNLMALFDAAAITVTGWTVTSWKRVLDAPSPPDEVDGIVVYQNNFQYDMLLSK